MSETRFPPVGVRCLDCGCCYANVYAGDDPLCWACDAGSHDPKKQSPVVSSQSSVPPAVQKAEPATPLTVKDGETTATPVQEESMPKGKYQRPGAVPCAAEGCENSAYPPRKYCSKQHFYLNKPGAKTGGGKLVRDNGKDYQKPAPAAIVRHPQVKSEERAIQRAIEPAAPIVITGDVSPAAAEKFWSILSVEQKQQIVKASIFSILNPAQEA